MPKCVAAVAIVLFLVLAAPAGADPPSITVPGNITQEATSASGAVVTYSETAVDTLDGPITQNSCDTPSGSTFPIGTTTVTCTAADSNTPPDTSSASFTVTVQDTTPPTLSLPPPITTAATSASGASVSYSASANDLVDGGLSPGCAPGSGSTFPIGTTTVTCTATDARGNGASGQFMVTVQDTAPAVTIPSPISAAATSASGASVSYSASATDAVDGPLPVTCAPTSGSTFPIGQTTVSCSATDSVGNQTTQTFTVTVADTAGPALSIPSGITAEATSASGVTVTFSASAVDAVDGKVSAGCSPGSGSTFPLGKTTVNCGASDSSHNTTSGSFTVTVQDTTGPAIAVPGPVTARAAGPPGTSVTFSVSATDAVDGTVTATCTPASTTAFPLGVTTVHCSAKDAAGNTTMRTFTVTVIDRTPPPTVVGVKGVASGGRVVLNWANPQSGDFDHVEVYRTRLPNGKPVGVYNGRGTSFVDAHAENGVRYRYTVFAVDAAGNRSGLALTLKQAVTELVRPAAGAQLSAPPTLLWVPAAGADYYNVELFRGATKVLSVWPRHNHLALARTWTFAGTTRTLSPGVYRWYVWPGHGRPTQRKYGALIGSSTFVVKG